MSTASDKKDAEIERGSAEDQFVLWVNREKRAYAVDAFSPGEGWEQITVFSEAEVEQLQEAAFVRGYRQCVEDHNK